MISEGVSGGRKKSHYLLKFWVKVLPLFGRYIIIGELNLSRVTHND